MEEIVPTLPLIPATQMEPADPNPSDAPRHLNTGDAHDDDSAVLNSLVESAAEPPHPDTMPQTPNNARTEPRPLTRLMTGTQTLANTWQPVLILPADSGRVALRLMCFSGTATDIVRVSDDAGKLQASSTAHVVNVNTAADLSLHNGPVWVSCPDAVGSVTVTWSAVTA